MRFIPPPCPVDDAPHTTCTSADYVPAAPIVIVQIPCRDGVQTVALPALPPVAPPPSDTAFTTSTYRREIHGPKRRRP
jgi:hypothetical protein